MMYMFGCVCHDVMEVRRQHDPRDDFSPRDWMCKQFQSGSDVPGRSRELPVFNPCWNPEEVGSNNSHGMGQDR